MFLNRFWIIFVLVVSLSSSFAFSQASDHACDPPRFKIEKEKNMFNDQQEVWLAEILDEQFGKNYNFIEDPEGDYLQQLGERLLKQLPPSDKKYHFHIIDDPDNNAFSLGGTTVYVSRQLIAFLKNEDELAGLLGHEIGHIYTHQRAIDLTREFRKVLGVQQVGDRQDVFDKWNQFEDVWRKKPVAFDQDREEEEQQIADRVGLYAMMRAGYQPSQLAAFFDRFTENKGKKGNLFSDLFGLTTPESKRVRLLIEKANMPSECVSTEPTGSVEHFLAWQQGVIGAKRMVAKQQVPDLLNKVALQPPLRGSLECVQFSPDGNYILARDESSVFVLQSHPLANLFRFDALNPQGVDPEPVFFGNRPDLSALSDEPAQFTPDSRSVIFYDRELRVQKWDIASQQRELMKEVAVTAPGRCLRTSLSSTGEILACVRIVKDDFRLLLIDVASNTTFFQKKLPLPFLPDIYALAAQPYRFFPSSPFDWYATGFSPDSRYFVLGSGSTTVAYDLQERREVPTNGTVRRFTSSRFVFTSPGELAALDPDHKDRLALLHFPSGDIQEQFPLIVNGQPLVNVQGVEGKLMAPGRGAYLLVSPAGRWPMAMFDLEGKNFVLGYKSPGLAVYTETLAAEEIGGTISLFRLSDRKRLSTVQLPLSPLPRLASSAFSSDGKWLAIAGRTSGGIWNVETGERTVSTGTFTGGFFDQGKLFAIFHRLEQQPKVESLDPASGKEDVLYTIDLPDPHKKNGSAHNYVWQTGNLLIEQVDKKEAANCLNHSTVPWAQSNCERQLLCFSCKLYIQARDVRTNEVLWVHSFVEFLPKFFYSEASRTLTLLFESHYSVKAEITDKPDLKNRFESMPDKDSVNLMEVLDPDTGNSLGSALIDTGASSIVPVDAVTAADTVLVHDNQNRTQVYSLKTGRLRGRAPGRFRAISSDGSRMLVENAKGECKVYDTASLQPVQQFQLPMRVIQADFIADGSLLILDADQVVYRTKPPGSGQPAQPAASEAK